MHFYKIRIKIFLIKNRNFAYICLRCHPCENLRVYMVVILWLQREWPSLPLHSKAFHTWVSGEWWLLHSTVQHSRPINSYNKLFNVRMLRRLFSSVFYKDMHCMLTIWTLAEHTARVWYQMFNVTPNYICMLLMFRNRNYLYRNIAKCIT